jgi:hypothetical protein
MKVGEVYLLLHMNLVLWYQLRTPNVENAARIKEYERNGNDEVNDNKEETERCSE